jgi:hypothetical protein
MHELVVAGGPELFSNDNYYWLIVAATAGLVSAVSIAQETRTTSLLLSRWASLLAAVMILLDVVAAELVAYLVVHRLPLQDEQALIGYIGVAAAAPTLLRGFKVTVGKTSIGPFVAYDAVRGALLVRLDDEFGTRMEMKARLIAGKAHEHQIEPEALAHVMKALVNRGRRSSATKSQIGHILGALRAGSVEDQVERLVELMYEYRMRSLLRALETGRITEFLRPSRPVYLVSQVEATPPENRPASKRPPTRRDARSQPSSCTPAHPDADPQASGRSGRQGQEQGPRGS